MSYRAFKRLLGETSLERKCRFWFAGGTFTLIAGSFWLYAFQTERLAYDPIRLASRLLVGQIVKEQIATTCRVKSRPPNPEQREVLEEFQKGWDDHWPEALQKKYRYSIFFPTDSPRTGDDIHRHEQFKAFQADPDKNESDQILSKFIHYYGAIRATPSCLACHQNTNPDLKEGDLIAMVDIGVPTETIENGVHLNRAVLISNALVTVVLTMIGSWLIVRYVIVKPIKHLKEVSDAISAGELNIRSEIQTGDEFEDLSHAFNRMLRGLVSMQDRLRKVNSDLDHKVDELAQANLALYESNRLKSDFLATMSHELRTPLNSILGFSEVLRSGTGLTEKQLRWAGNIQSSGERLRDLINDILDLAKIEAGKMQVRLVEFSAYDVCEGLLTMFRPMAEKKNIDLRSSMAPGIPLLRQDVVKFQQILSNLLSNAIKFTPEGGRVLLQIESEASDIVVTVVDTGVGIAPEEQDHVFEKFRQAANPLTREYAGTGLGLSIVRELSKLLGGDVTLQSELGRGSSFTVRLPLQRSDEPRLEFDLAREGIDLSKAQRIDVRLYTPPPPANRLDSTASKVEAHTPAPSRPGEPVPAKE